MTCKINKNLKLLLHPYIFVLKQGAEGKEAQDLLNYSLMMVQVGRLEVIPSPKNFLFLSPRQLSSS